MSTKRAHGIDISTFQGKFDPGPEHLIDIDFVILRTTISDSVLDDGFAERNFFEAALRVPLRGAYHFFRTLRFNTSELLPESSVQKKFLKGPMRTVVLPNGNKQEVPEALIRVTEKQGPNWDVQAKFFLETVKGKEFHFYALDIETGRDPAVFIGKSQNIFTAADVQNIKRWIEFVKEKTGKRVLLYTNQNIYDNLLLPHGGLILTELDLWLAGYPPTPKRDEDEPLFLFPINKGQLKNWNFWQYSADGNNQGSAFGATSPHIDLDVFNGPVEKLREWIGFEESVPGEQTVMVETIVQEVNRIEVGRPDSGGNRPSVSDTNPVPIPTPVPVPVHPPFEEPPKQDGFTVEVIADKTLLQSFKSRDNAGKPIMEIHEPRIRLNRGSRLFVSSIRKESPKDQGDGVIHGTGNVEYFFVIDPPSNPQEGALYVEKEDVKVI